MSTELILVPVIESILGKDGDRLVILLVAGAKERQMPILPPRKLTGATISAGNGKRYMMALRIFGVRVKIT